MTVALLLLAISVAGVAAIRRRWVVVTVRGASMAPTLRSGDRVLVRRRSGAAVGDVVVVDEPRPCRRGGAGIARADRWVVKRVVEVAGDPPGPHVLLGDNVEFSRDSRHYGPVPAARMLGVVLRRLGSGRDAERRVLAFGGGADRVDAQHVVGVPQVPVGDVVGPER